MDINMLKLHVCIKCNESVCSTLGYLQVYIQKISGALFTKGFPDCTFITVNFPARGCAKPFRVHFQRRWMLQITNHKNEGDSVNVPPSEKQGFM